jgi:hypothetical protein
LDAVGPGQFPLLFRCAGPLESVARDYRCKGWWVSHRLAVRPIVNEPPSEQFAEVKKMNQPLKKFRAGQISCALWENEVTTKDGRTVQMLKATVERRYKDKNGEWKSGNSFGRNEIPLVKWCLGKAFEAMVEERSVQTGAVEEEVVE